MNIGKPIEEELKESFTEFLSHYLPDVAFAIIFGYWMPLYALIMTAFVLMLMLIEHQADIFPSTNYTPQGMKRKIKFINSPR